MQLMVLQQRLAKPAPPRRLFDRLAFFSTRKALLKMLQLKCAAASFLQERVAILLDDS